MESDLLELVNRVRSLRLGGDGAGRHRWQAMQHPMIAAADSGGAAARAGLWPGDVLTHINALEITPRAGSDAIADVRASGSHLITVVRGGGSLTVTVHATPARS